MNPVDIIGTKIFEPYWFEVFFIYYKFIPLMYIFYVFVFFKLAHNYSEKFSVKITALQYLRLAFHPCMLLLIFLSYNIICLFVWHNFFPFTLFNFIIFIIVLKIYSYFYETKKLTLAEACFGFIFNNNFNQDKIKFDTEIDNKNNYFLLEQNKDSSKNVIICKKCSFLFFLPNIMHKQNKINFSCTNCSQEINLLDYLYPILYKNLLKVNSFTNNSIFSKTLHSFLDHTTCPYCGEIIDCYFTHCFYCFNEINLIKKYKIDYKLNFKRLNNRKILPFDISNGTGDFKIVKIKFEDDNNLEFDVYITFILYIPMWPLFNLKTYMIHSKHPYVYMYSASLFSILKHTSFYSLKKIILKSIAMILASLSVLFLISYYSGIVTSGLVKLFNYLI